MIYALAFSPIALGVLAFGAFVRGRTSIGLALMLGAVTAAMAIAALVLSVHD